MSMQFELDFAFFSAIFSMALGAALSVIGGIALHRYKAGEKEKQEQNELQKQFLVHAIQGIGAAIALGEANAVARKNGQPNGETEDALRYARAIKHDQKDFLTRMGVKNLFQG